MTNDVILLVDDNRDDVTMTLRAFAKNKIDNRVVVARDGAEALDLLQPTDGAEPLRPVLILLDLNMPRVGGVEVLRRLRAEPATRSMPVIVLTTSDDDQDVIESYEFAASSFVRKPVTSEDFLRATKTLSMYWLMVATATLEWRHPEPTDDRPPAGNPSPKGRSAPPGP